MSRAYAGGAAPLWVKFAVPLAVFWICYPVSQLSSLGGPTIWLPLDPGVFGRLARKPGVVLGFYAVSAVVLAVFGVAFRWVFLTAGQYTYTPDHRPYIGETQVSGLFMNSGYSGHGIMGSAGGSRLAIDAMLGQLAPQANPFRVDRPMQDRTFDVL